MHFSSLIKIFIEAQVTTYRLQVFYGMTTLKDFIKYTAKHLCWSSTFKNCGCQNAGQIILLKLQNLNKMSRTEKDQYFFFLNFALALLKFTNYESLSLRYPYRQF